MYYEQRFFSYYLVIMYFCIPHYCELAPPFTLIRASAHSLLRFSTAADKSEWFLWFWATQESPRQSHIFKTMYVAAKEKYERKITSGNKTNDTSVGDYRKITALLPQISGKPHTCSDCRVELQIFHVCVLTSLAKAHKFVLDVVIATLYKCLAEDKSSSLFGIKQWRGTSNHPENLMNRVRLISTRGLAAVPQPLQLILFCKAHLWIYLLCSVLRFYITGTYGMCDISFFLV